MSKRSNLIATALIFITILSGCKMEKGKSSDDIDAFRNLVETDVPAKSVRWEVFGTPEYTGGVPGPTDYVTLIAEVEPSAQEKIQTKAGSGEVWIAPEAARPWLTSEFRSLLAAHADRSTDLAGMPNCRLLRGKIKKDGKPVSGFICNGSGKSLIYLTLSGETGP